MKTLDCYGRITPDNIANGLRNLAENENDHTYNKYLWDFLLVSQSYWNEGTLDFLKKKLNQKFKK